MTVIVDLGDYLPNVGRSVGHDLVTAGGERCAFKWASSFWSHRYECYMDWWQYVDFPGQGHYLFYFFGDYDCPASHDLWGETPAIRTVPRHWDDAVPFEGSVQYVGTRLRWVGSKWSVVQTVDFTATTTVRRIAPAGELSEPTIRVTMEEKSAGSTAAYVYDLSDGLPVNFGTPADKGIQRFRVFANGALTKDMTFASWVPR